ncbi:MAG: hypothetical protein L0211_13875 [Planctomycetaceae bacterium]|nr:hypothetical protein [Planctomycetaceae bacterium]
MELMKAIVYDSNGSPDVFKCEEIEKPTARDGEVLIKVRAASVNPMDWRMKWETGPSIQDEQAASYSGVPWLIRAEDGDHSTGPVSRRGGLVGGPGYPP